MYAQYTFESFVPGPSNRQALFIAQAVADSPNTAPSPIYLHGPVACGKSHLLYAIKNHIAKAAPERNVIYKKFDDFTGELIRSICSDRIQDLRSTYCSADVLLMDDVQYIQGKEATQEEFLLILRGILTSGGKAVLTSTCPLDALCFLKDSALFTEAEILPPDTGHKQIIAASKASEYGLSLPDTVLSYLANRGNNIRQIEGALKRILAHRELGTIELT